MENEHTEGVARLIQNSLTADANSRYQCQPSVQKPGKGDSQRGPPTPEANRALIHVHFATDEVFVGDLVRKGPEAVGVAAAHFPRLRECPSVWACAEILREWTEGRGLGAANGHAAFAFDADCKAQHAAGNPRVVRQNRAPLEIGLSSAVERCLQGKEKGGGEGSIEVPVLQMLHAILCCGAQEKTHQCDVSVAAARVHARDSGWDERQLRKVASLR